MLTFFLEPFSFGFYSNDWHLYPELTAFLLIYIQKNCARSNRLICDHRNEV